MPEQYADDGGPSTLRHAIAPMAEPQNDDVVVVCAPGATPPFGVKQVPHAVQFGASTRDDAVQLARSFAQSRAVDLWCSDGGDCRLLERHRHPGPITTEGRQ